MNFSFKITFFQKFAFQNNTENAGEDAEESIKCKVYTKVEYVVAFVVIVTASTDIFIAIIIVDVVNFVPVVSGCFQVAGLTGKDSRQVRHCVGHGGR